MIFRCSFGCTGFLENISLDRTYTYKYDNRGNILEKRTYTYIAGTALGNPISTVTYGYTDADWQDKLTSYEGKPITYDANGNPLTFDGYTYTWEAGRQLTNISSNGLTAAYTYDDSNIRTSKTVNGIITNYTLNGSKIIGETTGNTAVYYRYSSDDELVGLFYDGQEYFYVRNLQNDIIGIVNANGTICVTYTYDAWGNVTVSGSMASTLGIDNPFRYRGYYYDKETGLYYLQSRYYNPQIGRFINADKAEIILLSSIISIPNLYTYCENNVVMNSDPTGEISLNSIKNTLMKPINALVNRVKDMINRIRIIYRNGILTIYTGAIAIAIDAISFAISKITHFAVKTGLKLLVAWGKSNTKQFFPFAKQYIVNNAIRIVANFLQFMCRKMAISVSWSKFTNKVGNSLFGNSRLYKIYNAFSSLGNITATIFDLLDGRWDDKLVIRVRWIYS